MWRRGFKYFSKSQRGDQKRNISTWEPTIQMCFNGASVSYCCLPRYKTPDTYMKAAAVETICHLVGVFIEIWLLVDRRGGYSFFFFFFFFFFAGMTQALFGFTHSASTHSLTVCVSPSMCVCVCMCVCLPPSCLPASDSVPPSFSLLLLLLSLGLLAGKTPTHSLSLNPGNKRGAAAGAGLTSPGAHHLWSSSGCLSDRRVCWNIHVFFFFFFLPCWVARIVISPGSAVVNDLLNVGL